MSRLTEAIAKRTEATIAQYAQQIEQRHQAIDAKTSKRGAIDRFADGGVWVLIVTEDGGGTAFVTLETGRACAVGQAITVAGDRGYF